MNDEFDERGLTRMTFKGYTDNTFDVRADSCDIEGYKVRINPETFDRTLNVNRNDEKTARSDNSSGDDAGVGAETYSFDLIFDGTGVAGTVLKGKALKEEFNTFLGVVYANMDDPAKKKVANCVTIEYCGETFRAKLASMTIKYLLFQRDGNPLRIKATCSFTSVDKKKKDPDPEEKKPKPKITDKPAVKPDSTTKECCCPCPTYEETVSKAEENDSVSLMSCNYTREEMTPTSSSSPRQSLNYTPAYPMSY